VIRELVDNLPVILNFGAALSRGFPPAAASLLGARDMVKEVRCYGKDSRVK